MMTSLSSRLSDEHLKPESPISFYEDFYYKFRNHVSHWLKQFEARPQYNSGTLSPYGRGGHSAIDVEDLLIGADVMFMSLNALIEGMREAQELIDGYEEEEQDDDYNQALGEIISLKRVFVTLLKKYDMLEQKRAHVRGRGDVDALTFFEEFSILSGDDRRKIDNLFLAGPISTTNKTTLSPNYMRNMRIF